MSIPVCENCGASSWGITILGSIYGFDEAQITWDEDDSTCFCKGCDTIIAHEELRQKFAEAETKEMSCLVDRSAVVNACKAILDDDCGVSEQAWLSMVKLLQAVGGDHLISQVRATDGRFYLPESSGSDDKSAKGKT